jgi:DNA-directed RNA polymerase sigma subunit (sigma70/sigma32)
MLFVTIEDFYEKAASATKLSRDEEKTYAAQMQQGDLDARQAIINSYLPYVAACIKRAPERIQTIKTVYACLNSLEQGVDQFSFLQDHEPFHHHLSWRMRQCITRCIADR